VAHPVWPRHAGTGPCFHDGRHHGCSRPPYVLWLGQRLIAIATRCQSLSCFRIRRKTPTLMLHGAVPDTSCLATLDLRRDGRSREAGISSFGRCWGCGPVNALSRFANPSSRFPPAPPTGPLPAQTDRPIFCARWISAAIERLEVEWPGKV
jgi:hypothetical protein